MNSKALRRLAADHGALHNQDLPPYFLFPVDASHTDDLTQLDILLAGPPATPFAAGVWKLHLAIPPQYPEQAPTANFRTPIFHPNVDPNTGGICVETLKRDWSSKLTLRDILVTISCLLVYPNPDSALNAEAGALIQEGFEAFSRRAELMTSIHANVHSTLAAAVKEAQNRGQETSSEKDVESEQDQSWVAPEAPVRRRRTLARVREMKRSETSPTGGAPARRRQPGPPAPPPMFGRPFVHQTRNDDVFGASTPLNQITRSMGSIDETDHAEDSEMADADQENDTMRSPAKSPTTIDARTPRRPHGVAVPLGELIIPEQDDYDTSIDNVEMEMEPEYPPSPNKSLSKSPAKSRRPVQTYTRAESSRDATLRGNTHITPPKIVEKPLAEDSPFGWLSVSPRKRRGKGIFETPGQNRAHQADSSFLDHSFLGPATPQRVTKQHSPSSSEKRQQEQQRQAELDAKLWELCGRDIKRWNRGDFDGEIFKKTAPRW